HHQRDRGDRGRGRSRAPRRRRRDGRRDRPARGGVRPDARPPGAELPHAAALPRGCLARAADAATVARGQLELLAAELDRVEQRQSVAVTTSELDRMARMVDDLLLLARLDEGMQLERDAVEMELLMA